MRPLKLEINGLTSFSTPVTVDFSDVSLFALVGPTGAGKSSVIDAMTLALYGRIPRLRASEIAPVIAMTGSECTVGLEFTVRGRGYRAVRKIRRTGGNVSKGRAPTGASTVEAVLEALSDDGGPAAILAGSADDMTEEVERLIGLSFDEFTRAVVLPQGEFARVLRAQTAERQKLLARLLGTGIYDRLKYHAGVHARAAEDRAVQTAHHIAQLGPVSAEALAEVAQRRDTLTALVDELAVDREALDEVRERYSEAAVAAKTAADVVTRLRAVGPPPDEVIQLGDAIRVAEEDITKHAAALGALEERLTAEEEAASDAEQIARWRQMVTLHQATPGLREAVEEASLTLPAAEKRVTEIDEQLTSARASAATAAETLAKHRRDHAAAAAAAGLTIGDACPVCAAELTSAAPALKQDGADDDVDALLSRAETAQSQAVTAVGRLEGDLTAARRAVEAASAELTARKGRLDAHLAELDGAPSADALTAQIAEAAEQQKKLQRLRDELRSVRTELSGATRRKGDMQTRAAGLAGSLDRMRLGVADVDPPELRGDVAASWEQLHTWASWQLPERAAAADRAREAVEEIQQRGTELRQAMEVKVADAGVEPGKDDPRDRAVAARAAAAAEVERMTQMLSMVERLQAEEADAREQQLVGSELARLLRADQFQKWLLDEATRGLVAGASSRLMELSDGRYQLKLDRRNAIQVVDLASAGTIRSIRTLSGGETFLASLALALSLAEQIAVSAAGPVALESLFIDEGFGALDPETLDMAAGAIEQLSSGERIVGVVSHVAEMAERLPTRFVVQRTGDGSRVERVDV